MIGQENTGLRGGDERQTADHTRGEWRDNELRMREGGGGGERAVWFQLITVWPKARHRSLGIRKVKLTTLKGISFFMPLRMKKAIILGTVQSV